MDLGLKSDLDNYGFGSKLSTEKNGTCEADKWFLLVSLLLNFFEFLSLWLPKAFGPKGEC
jgi:hypothetical protein